MKDSTDIGGANDGWPSTAKLFTDGDPANSRKEEVPIVMEQYWKPVYAYIRATKGFDNEKAKDLTQSFFTEKVLAKGLVEKYNPEKARFRTFLKVVLKRYVNRCIRYDDALMRRPRGGLTSLNGLDEGNLPAVESGVEPSEAFDQEWSTIIVEKALANTKKKLTNRGKKAHWEVFEKRIVRPLLKNQDKSTVAELAQEYDVTEGTISRWVAKAMKIFKQTVRELILEYSGSEDSADEELNDLIRLISEDGANPGS